MTTTQRRVLTSSLWLICSRVNAPSPCVSAHACACASLQVFAPSAQEPAGERRGYAGGFLERDLGGPVYRRQEQDDEYDEFGRRKWKRSSADAGEATAGDGQQQGDDADGDYYDFGSDDDEANYGYEAPPEDAPADEGSGEADASTRRYGDSDDDDDDDDDEEESSGDEGDVSKYDLLEDAPVADISVALGGKQDSAAQPSAEPLVDSASRDDDDHDSDVSSAPRDEGRGLHGVGSDASSSVAPEEPAAKPESWDWGAAEKAEKLRVRERAKELQKKQQWEDAQRLQRQVRDPSPPRRDQPQQHGYDGDDRDREYRDRGGYDPRRDRDARRRSRSPPSGQHRGYGARSRSRSPPARRRYGRPSSPPPVRALPGPPLPPPEAVLHGGPPPGGHGGYGLGPGPAYGREGPGGGGGGHRGYARSRSPPPAARANQRPGPPLPSPHGIGQGGPAPGMPPPPGHHPPYSSASASGRGVDAFGRDVR